MNTSASIEPAPLTDEELNDLRRRVLSDDPSVTSAELRRARIQIRQRHLAAGFGASKTKDIKEALDNNGGDNALSGW